MAMTINLTEALAGLNRLASISMQPWLAEVGKMEVAVIQNRIKYYKHPPNDDETWSPWKQRTRLHRLAAGTASQGLLWDSGTLVGSITSVPGPNEVEVGTNLIYAKRLQEGRTTPTNMVARPFVGWSDTEYLEGSAIAFIERWMK